MLQTADGRHTDFSERSRELTIETRASDKKRQQLQKIGSDAAEKKEMMLAMMRDQTDTTNATSSKVRCLMRHLETINQLQCVDPSSGITYENRIKFLEVELQAEKQSNIAIVRELQEQHSAAIATLGGQVAESATKLTEERNKTTELLQSLAVVTEQNAELVNSKTFLEEQVADLTNDIKYSMSEKLNLDGMLQVALQQVAAAMETARLELGEKERMARENIECRTDAEFEHMKVQFAEKRILEMERKEQKMIGETNLLRENVNEHAVRRDSLQEEVASLRSARQQAETRCMVLESSARDSEEHLTAVRSQNTELLKQITALNESINQKDQIISSTTSERDTLKSDLTNHETLKKESDEYINQLKQSVSDLQEQLSQQGFDREVDSNKVKVLTSLQASLSEKLVSSLKEKDDVETKNSEVRRNLATLEANYIEKEEELRQLHKALQMCQRLNSEKDNMIEQADSEAAAARQTLAEWNARHVLNQVEGVKSPLTISEDSKEDIDRSDEFPPPDPDEHQNQRLAVNCDDEVMMATPTSLEGDDEDFVPCSPIADDVPRTREQPDRPSEIHVSAHSDDDLGITHYGCKIIAVNEGSLANTSGVLPGDRILSVDGIRVETKDEVNEAFEQVTGSYRLVISTEALTL